MAGKSGSKSRNDREKGIGAGQLSSKGVSHPGLVTERDIDAEFGLFTEEEEARAEE